MKQVLLKDGNAILDDVPVPNADPGTILVRVHNSCISVGTEIAGMKSGGVPLWKRALQQPQNVKKALQMVREQGLSTTRAFVKDKVSTPQPTGYSAAGIIVEVGEGVTDLEPGMRVACAGAQCAFHAEYIRVPRNLAVPIPDKVEFTAAATVTLGAIALQGVRRANPTLGETFVVLGLGVVGQIVAQILAANGCKVIGVDPDIKRLELAEKLGVDTALDPSAEDSISQIHRVTGGHGADGVIVAAAASSDQVISNAFQMCRKKGRVVLVGDVGLNLQRRDFYHNELDLLISTSYGPGRYDGAYEEGGLDYPISYVRWTENRNMGAYLDLLAAGKTSIAELIGKTFPIDDAPGAYDSLNSGSVFPPMALFEFPASGSDEKIERTILNPTARPSKEGKIGVAVVGAGGFAKGTHLPNLRSLSEQYSIEAIVSASGHNANSTAKEFGARYASTDYSEVLLDSNVDAVISCTPHNLHASAVLSALRSGKHVLVEKPLALDPEELSQIQSFYDAEDLGKSKSILMTGFNRRFSPAAVRAKALVANRSAPMIMNYRMNGGFIPPEKWVHGPQGGGRNIGEACHIYDFFVYLTGAACVNVHATNIQPTDGQYLSQDNFVATLRFDDGSVATLVYTAMGSSDYPKESMEIFVDGKVIVLDNYKRLTIAGSDLKGVSHSTIQKGHREELEAFAIAINKGGEWPIPLWQQLEATQISFEVEKYL